MTKPALFYVIDHDGNISYSAKREAPEHFTTRGAAIRRAQELAAIDPGKTVCVAEGIDLIICEVAKPSRTVLVK
jgi:hypothetical protein